MTLNLEVRPGIFRDGTYTVFAKCQDGLEERYQLRGRFEDVSAAKDYAARIMSQNPDRFSSEILIGDELEIAGDWISGLSEDTLSKQLMENGENELRATWSRRLDALPVLTSLALIGYYLWSTLVDTDHTLRMAIGVWAPFVLAGLSLSNRTRAWLRSRKYTRECKSVAELALVHGWRRENFFPLLMSLQRPLRHEFPFVAFRGWHYDPVPAGFEQVGLEFMFHTELPDDFGPLTLTALTERLRDEDFEARIQAISTLTNSSEPVRFSSLRCLATSRRAVRRARALVLHGIADVAYLDTAALPGFDDYRNRRRLVGPPILFMSAVVATAIGWSFLYWPAHGWASFALISVCVILGTIPAAWWNIIMILRCQGLPKGFSWVDLQGDMQIIRGL